MHNLSLFAVPGFVAQMLMYTNVCGADDSCNITGFCFSLLVTYTSNKLQQESTDYRDYRLVPLKSEFLKTTIISQ